MLLLVFLIQPWPDDDELNREIAKEICDNRMFEYPEYLDRYSVKPTTLDEGCWRFGMRVNDTIAI